MVVSVPGAELFCRTRGSGPVCLVLCNLGTEVVERQILPPLENHLTLVYVDLRGSGQSTGEPGSLTFDALAEDLEAVRRHLGVERVAVFGWSILGALAIEYARRRPETVSQVIAVGTPPKGSIPWLVVTTLVEDPQYLNARFIVSSHFKKALDGSAWEPRPCEAQ